MSEKDENIVEERVFSVPISSTWTAPIKDRTPRAVRILRLFVTKQMKAEEIAISTEVNEEMWRRGAEGSPRHLRVRAAKARDGRATIFLVRESKGPA